MKKIFLCSLVSLLLLSSSVYAQPVKTVRASWHDYSNDKTVSRKYRNGHIVASRGYPCGTIIKVWNAKDPSKSIIVVVRDWGPAKWTKRGLDLNKPAFAKLAPTSRGEITVKYQVLRYGRKCVHRH